MSRLLISHDGFTDWHVWITLPGHDPIKDKYGFVIGCGSTRDEAVAAAVADLESGLDLLQSPPGVIEEREVRPVWDGIVRSRP